MLNKTRRNILNIAWTTPVITAISLPAHAQTSDCSVADLVGVWRFTSATHTVPDLNPTFELFADGSTSDLASTWSINNGEFVLRQDISDFVFTAPVTGDCNNLSGTSTTIFTGPPDNLPADGTWSAERAS